ncbi:Hypothetical protein SCF082_LOCUS23924 [Durusdinium trenchii]|uniref:Uncharacterized protein n=1 Tax=Durusdinium trenchii TaxID=1381693 RepID=A0ABP0LS24_9DINO
MWHVLNRFIAKTTRRNEYMAAQKTAQEVMEGEDKIVESMRRFANDAKCVEYLKTFKEDSESKIAAYRKAFWFPERDPINSPELCQVHRQAACSAYRVGTEGRREALVVKMQEDLTERASKQLQAIAAFEAGMGSAMQDLVVREAWFSDVLTAAASFKEKFPGDKGMQDKAFSAAVKALSGAAVEVAEDPVAKHFADAFQSLQGVDLASSKADAKGSLAERVAFAQQAKEKEFQESFMVTPKEAEEVKSLASKAKSGQDYDFSKMPAEALQRLEALYTSINAKATGRENRNAVSGRQVGYALPDGLGAKPLTTTSDSTANSYVDKVNAQLSAATAKLRDARLKAFVEAF